MNWIIFTDEQRVRFLELLLRLNHALFIQLFDYEKSLFYHYWHKVFNEHSCWLLESEGYDRAFVSRPDWQAKHWMRWPENFLLLDPELHELPMLPATMKDVSSFRTGYSDTLFDGNRQTISVKQTAYAINLTNFELLGDNTKNADVEYGRLDSRDLNEIQALLSDPQHDSAPYYRNELQRMLAHNARAHYGFGYRGILKGTGLPVAVVFYEAFEMPLTGTPCMLVTDILVKKQYRGEGIATNLQRFAYADMKARGIRWIIGNIASDNHASVQQALKLGRIPWAQQITIASG